MLLPYLGGALFLMLLVGALFASLHEVVQHVRIHSIVPAGSLVLSLVYTLVLATVFGLMWLSSTPYR